MSEAPVKQRPSLEGRSRQADRTGAPDHAFPMLATGKFIIPPNFRFMWGKH